MTGRIIYERTSHTCLQVHIKSYFLGVSLKRLRDGFLSEVYNRVRRTKHETCAILHRSHVLYVSHMLSACVNGAFD